MFGKKMTDAELVALKTRSRHRLIGTIALAVIFVIAVPMLLDRQAPISESAKGAGSSESVTAQPELKEQAPKPSSESEATPGSLPSNNSAPVAGDPGRESTPATPPTAGSVAGGSIAPESVAAGSKDHSAPIQIPSEKMTAPDVIPPIPNPTAPGAKQTAKLEARVKAIEHPAVIDSTTKAESTQSDSGKSESAKSENMKGWFVQLGVFAEEARAIALRDRLQERGVSLQTDTIQGPRGTFTRLRAGPFPEREVASVLLARIKALGENAILVHQ
jgi:DedD protein